MTRSLAAVAILAVVAVASPAGAQSTSSQPTTASSGQQPSLGELAKREAARRKADASKGDAPKKVYTNSDLKPAPAPEASDASGDKTAPGGDQAKADGKTAPADKDKKDADKTPPEQTQQYWHDRMQKAQEDLQHNQMYAEALQSRINGLSADFAARDDPYQRAQIADDRQKALAELDRVNDEIKKGQEAIATIEDEARKANVPAGWIR